MKSSLKAWILLLCFSLLIIAIGHAVAGRDGILWTLVIALSINTLVYLFLESRFIGILPGVELEGRDPWGVNKIVGELCLRAKIPMPKIHLTESTSVQIYAVGNNLQTSHLILTRGMVEKLQSAELEAAIAYGIATIQHHDTFLFLVVGFLSSLLLSVTRRLDAVLRWLFGAKRKQNLMANFSTGIVSLLYYPLLRVSLSNQLYFLADETAAKLIGSSKLVAQTLWKMHSYSLTLPCKVSASYAHAFMVNPLVHQGWSRYFHAQPNVELRIRKLIGYYPF